MKLVFEKIEVINNIYCIIFTDGITKHKWDGEFGKNYNKLEDVINEILKENQY
jgi:hypothetical protein